MSSASSAKSVEDSIRAHAVHGLGIHSSDVERFLWLAEDSLRAPCQRTGPYAPMSGNDYYYNSLKGDSSWEHPADASCRQLYYRIKAGIVESSTSNKAPVTKASTEATLALPSASTQTPKIDAASETGKSDFETLRERIDTLEKERAELTNDLEHVTTVAEEQVQIADRERSLREVAEATAARLQKNLEDADEMRDELIAEKAQLNKNLEALIKSVNESTSSSSAQAKLIEDGKIKVQLMEERQIELKKQISKLRAELEEARAASSVPSPSSSRASEEEIERIKSACNEKINEANQHAGKIIRESLAKKLTLQKTIGALRARVKELEEHKRKKRHK